MKYITVVGGLLFAGAEIFWYFRKGKHKKNGLKDLLWTLFWVLLGLFLAIPSFAAQVTLPPGTALPPPGAVVPPGTRPPWNWRDGGPPTLPEMKGSGLGLVPQNQFLLPAAPKEIQCSREVGADIASCKAVSK